MGDSVFPSKGDGARKQSSRGPGLPLGKGLPVNVGEGRTRNSGKKEVTSFVSQPKNAGHLVWHVSSLYHLA